MLVVGEASLSSITSVRDAAEGVFDGQFVDDLGVIFIERGRWRTAAAAALAVLVLGGGWLTWSLHRRTTADYVTQKLETVSLARIVTASGIVGPAATRAGRRSRVRRDPGARLRRQDESEGGPSLRENRFPPLSNHRRSEQIRSGESRGSVREDKADLAQAKAAAFDHTEALAKRRKAIEKARKAYEQAQARTKLDEATVGQLQAALDAAEINLGSTEVVSPIDGIVLSRNVKMDQTVAPGSETSPLFLIAADLAVIHVDAEASEKDIGGVKQGDKATFTVDAFPNRPFAGEVTQIRQSPQIYEHGATYNVVISAPNPDLLLEPGMTATIRIVID